MLPDLFTQRTAIICLLILSAASAPSSAQPDPKVQTYTLPDKIKWRENPGGPKYAVLAGDPSKRGLFIVLTKWAPHQMSHPHFHHNDVFITVISGTWWIGSGSKYDPDSTTPIPAGSFVTDYRSKFTSTEPKTKK